MHTPGPWRTEGGQIYSVAHERDYSLNPQEAPHIWRVVSVINGKTDDELRGNVALIAAAPELLAALQMLIDCKDVKDRLDGWEAGSTQEMAAMAEWYDEHQPKALAVARDVIAKATNIETTSI